jgi:hypothetical protein
MDRVGSVGTFCLSSTQAAQFRFIVYIPLSTYLFGSFVQNIYILYSVWISVVGIAYLFLDRLPYIRDQTRVESSELKPARATAVPSVTDEKNASRGVPAGSVV